MKFSARMMMLGAGVAAACPPAARADTWLVAEAPAAIPVSDAQSGVFRPGLMPAVGFYADRGALAFGVRARVGILSNGPAPGMNLSDPGVGGLGTVGVALRVAGRGPWAEAVLGGGLTGHDLVPAVEAGLGWDFVTGNVDVGPSLRVVHLVANGADMFGNADLALVGVDVRFGKDRPARIVHARRIAPAPDPIADVTMPPEVDSDPLLDPILARELEHEHGCSEGSEGCELAKMFAVHDDRIVLDERVLFDVDHARVKSGGRAILFQLAKLWTAHPEWVRLTVEGHADVRGTEEYNQDLSQRRAERVRAVLVKLGFAGDRIDAIGYGRSRPRDPGMTPEAHQNNRRVEFVIDRRGAP